MIATHPCFKNLAKAKYCVFLTNADMMDGCEGFFVLLNGYLEGWQGLKKWIGKPSGTAMEVGNYFTYCCLNVIISKML